MKIRDSFEVNPTKNSNKFADYINYIDTSSVNSGHLENITYLENDYPSRAKRLIKKGDILYSSVRPNLKHYYYFNDDIEHAVASTGFVLLREKKDNAINTKFVYYYLITQHIVDYLSGIAELSQATFPSFSSKDIEKIDLPNIPRERQDIIVDIISKYDLAIENNNKRIKILEQMIENLYKEWFVRFRFLGYEDVEFVNGIPQGWKVCKVKELVNRLPFGTLYKASDVESEGKVIVIDQSADEFVGFHSNEPSHIATIDEPIALFGDHSCKCVLMIEPFSLSENVIPYIAKKGIRTTYLFYVLNKIIETTEYKRHWSEFTSKKVLLAPIEIQNKFVDLVKNKLELINNIKFQNRNLIKQRDLLLPRLMSEKLHVK